MKITFTSEEKEKEQVFEEEFEGLLESEEYDGFENYLFEIVRSAFLAGWLARAKTEKK